MACELYLNKAVKNYFGQDYGEGALDAASRYNGDFRPGHRGFFDWGSLRLSFEEWMGTPGQGRGMQSILGRGSHNAWGLCGKAQETNENLESVMEPRGGEKSVMSEAGRW